MGALLDSTFLIAAERRKRPLSDALQEARELADSEDLGISAISVMELAHGEARAESEARAAWRSRFLDEVLAVIPVFAVNAEVARRAGSLDGQLQQLGTKLAYADVLIGTTALLLNYSIITRNLRHFDRIPNLRVIVHT